MGSGSVGGTDSAGSRGPVISGGGPVGGGPASPTRRIPKGKIQKLGLLEIPKVDFKYWDSYEPLPRFQIFKGLLYGSHAPTPISTHQPPQARHKPATARRSPSVYPRPTPFPTLPPRQSPPQFSNIETGLPELKTLSITRNCSTPTCKCFSREKYS